MDLNIWPHDRLTK